MIGSTEWQGLHKEIEDTLNKKFKGCRRSIIKNLAHLVIALVVVLRTPRGWYGRLSLSAIARGTRSKGNVKIRYKRLNRFLDNPFLNRSSLTKGLIELVLGKDKPKILPLLVDQTSVGGVESVVASYATEGRAIPLSIASFEKEEIRAGQNIFEETFLDKLSKDLKDINPLWIMDRGYARASLLARLKKRKQPFIIRGRRVVLVQYQDEEGKTRQTSVRRLKHRLDIPKRYSNVLYQDEIKVKVDIVVYRERGFKEPWFLVVPPNCEDILPTELVIECYRTRMNIETSFRDFKSCLGVRGLRLEVRKAERMDHLLAGMVITYILLLALGISDLGQQLRKELEVQRKKPRHGTRRTLSVLSIALMAVTDSFLLTLSNLMKILVQCLVKLGETRVFEPRLSVATTTLNRIYRSVLAPC